MPNKIFKIREKQSGKFFFPKTACGRTKGIMSMYFTFKGVTNATAVLDPGKYEIVEFDIVESKVHPLVRLKIT